MGYFYKRLKSNLKDLCRRYVGLGNKSDEQDIYDFRDSGSTLQPWVVISSSKKNQNFYRDLTLARLTNGIFLTEKFDFSRYDYDVNAIVNDYLPGRASGIFINYVPAYTAKLKLNKLRKVLLCGFIGDHYNFIDTTVNAIEKQNFYKKTDWDFLVTAYPNTNELVAKALAKKVTILSLPWAVDASVYKNLHMDRFYDIACMGALSEGKYPFRRKVREWLVNQAKIRVFKKTRVQGRSGSDHDGTAFNYALNKCRSAFTCASSMDYTLMKYFEIPATGALLFAERTALYDALGFIDGIHYIAVTPDDFMEKMNLYLSPNYSNAVNKIACAGMNFILENHTWENRILNFLRETKAMTSN